MIDDLMARLAAYREYLMNVPNPLPDAGSNYLKVTETLEDILEKFDETFKEVE